MGFFDKFKKKKDEPEAKEKESDKPAGKRVKKYTSDGKTIYE